MRNLQKIHDPAYNKFINTLMALSALQQIGEKNYDAVLIDRGIAKEKIRHYGFAFEGKRVNEESSKDP